MEPRDYDVWSDPNEVDETNHAQVLLGWARPGLDVTSGKVSLAGDDEIDPGPARILAYDDATEIITLEFLYDTAHSAVA